MKIPHYFSNLPLLGGNRLYRVFLGGRLGLWGLSFGVSLRVGAWDSRLEDPGGGGEP